MKQTRYAASSQGRALPEFGLCELTGFIESVYPPRAIAKSVAGIGLPKNYLAHRRQLTAGFFMRTICTHLIFADAIMRWLPYYGGLVEGASARRFRVGGKANLDQSTTHKIGLFGGGCTEPYSEAVVMTTTPTQAVSTAMIYTFLIAGGVHTLSGFKRLRTISVVAPSEIRDRKQLTGLPLVFISRTPNRTREGMA